MPNCLKNAWIYKNFGKSVDEIVEFVTAPVDKEEMKTIAKASSLVVASESKEIKSKERLNELIGSYENKKERNEKIFQAYRAGYSQQMIAEVVGMSQQGVGKIIN